MVFGDGFARLEAISPVPQGMRSAAAVGLSDTTVIWTISTTRTAWRVFWIISSAHRRANACIASRFAEAQTLATELPA